MKKLIRWFYYFERFVDRWWYSPILGICAALDHYVIVFPILGMMVSSIFLAPKKWFTLTAWSALGSWAGAWGLGFIARYLGFSFIQIHFPDMLASNAWDWAHEFFYHHGVWLVFLMGLLPIPQQPPVIIAALAGTPLVEIGVVLLLARFIKFTTIGYLASHAPQKLQRFRGVSKEMQELQIEATKASPN